MSFALSLGRDYCAAGCQIAKELGIELKSEWRNGQTRVVLLFPDGQIKNGAWREDPRRALVMALSLLPV